MAGNGRVFIGLDTTGIKMLVKNIGEGKKVFERPLAEGRADIALRLLRFGPKGIEQQFQDSREYRNEQSKAWDRTMPFGSIPAPDKTMIRTGAYMKAWLGLGPGSMPPSTDESVVTCGVDPKSFPQVAIHQGSKEEFTIRPKKPSSTRPGDWAMRWKLGLMAGVWMSIASIEKGIKIKRRRLSVSTEVRRAIAKEIHGHADARVRGLSVKTQRISYL